MTIAPAQPDKELLDVAARLVGVQTVDLMNVVTRADGTLVVLLCTGQKYTFNPDQLAAQLGQDLESYLQGRFGIGQIVQPGPAAPPAAAAPATKQPKAKK